MPPNRRPFFLAWVCTALFSAGQPIVPAAITPDPAPACPAPTIAKEAWRTITLRDCGIRLKLPEKYKEEQWDVAVNNPIRRSFRAGPFDQLAVNVRRSPNPSLADNKVKRQSDYQGYSECTEMIGGREAVVQSFRGGGGIIGPTGKVTTYHAGSISQLRPGQFILISGDLASREAQEEILAALRTVEFIPE
jgi:hypothetical protein